MSFYQDRIEISKAYMQILEAEEQININQQQPDNYKDIYKGISDGAKGIIDNSSGFMDSLGNKEARNAAWNTFKDEASRRLGAVGKGVARAGKEIVTDPVGVGKQLGKAVGNAVIHPIDTAGNLISNPSSVIPFAGLMSEEGAENYNGAQLVGDALSVGAGKLASTGIKNIAKGVKAAKGAKLAKNAMKAQDAALDMSRKLSQSMDNMNAARNTANKIYTSGTEAQKNALRNGYQGKSQAFELPSVDKYGNATVSDMGTRRAYAAGQELNKLTKTAKNSQDAYLNAQNNSVAAAEKVLPYAKKGEFLSDAHNRLELSANKNISTGIGSAIGGDYVSKTRDNLYNNTGRTIDTDTNADTAVSSN